MAKMAYNDSKEFESSSMFDTFSLADDGNSDKVQFLISTLDDILAYTAHEIPMMSKNNKQYFRKIGCLKTSKDDPVGTCPLCDSGMRIKVAKFIPLYSHTHKKVMLWERGSNFIDKNLSSCLNRLMANGKDMKNTVIEVVRCGRKGDSSTTYQLYPMDNIPPVDVTDIEVPDPEGGLIATWTVNDMTNYVQTGAVPATNSDNASSAQVQRRPRTTEDGNYGQPAMATPAVNAQTAAPAAPQFNGVPTQNPEDLF